MTYRDRLCIIVVKVTIPLALSVESTTRCGSVVVGQGRLPRTELPVSHARPTTETKYPVPYFINPFMYIRSMVPKDDILLDAPLGVNVARLAWWRLRAPFACCAAPRPEFSKSMT
ncbi:hypothetical protein KIN20_025292 [Parelaphostrongylus tenuis]|uniref:Secreted protein n=1 Tax=Parelaphostrongylus tenuis TaxID=148309 RepID=A0AAD5QX72_PARTN|nr:hypothetical protein KIN20_025292 [Parelaphostrongylus tenuis]